MNDNLVPDPPAGAAEHTLGASTLYRLCEELIALREKNERQHKLFEQSLRKVQAALARHGIQPYDAVLGSPYNPAIHERVGGKRMEGMEALRVAEQLERGYASQQPEFVLRRPKVIVSE